MSGYYSPAASTWKTNVKVTLAEFYGETSLVYKEFSRIWFSPGAYYDDQPESELIDAFNAGLDEAKGFLESRIEDLKERVQHSDKHADSTPSRPNVDTRRVFVVHGHDHGNKETVARFLSKLDLEPIILHEQPDQGRTVIEKFEAHAEQVSCAVVILTADDVGHAKNDPSKEELRARQNVVLELGFFVGKLGRNHTFALVQKGVALPSDIHGVVYIPLDESDWRLRLVRELRAAEIEVDANRAFS